MEKAYVKLRDTGSIFKDDSQSIILVGGKIVEVERNAFVNRAISANVLVLLDEETAKKEIAAYEEALELRKAKEEAELEELQAKNGNIKVVERVVEKVIYKEKESTKDNDDVTSTDVDTTKSGEGKEGVVGGEGTSESLANLGNKEEDSENSGKSKTTKQDYMAYNNDYLIAELKARGIDYSGATKKAEYAAMLSLDDDRKAAQ